MRIEMELARILIRELNNAQLIELREVDAIGTEPRSFPIVIGISEAIAIDRRLSGVEIGRPMTHDLLADTIEQLGATLDSIAITEIVDGTFYASLNLTDHTGQQIEIDARPSDAIALGITGDVPIYVDETVIEHAILPPMDDFE
jgi:bifunctional DNase/RNase